MPIVYKNKKLKEIFCKNDNCRKLLGYEMVKKGELLFICPKCKFVSDYDITRGDGQILVEQLDKDIKYEGIEDINLTKKGGE